MEVLYTAVQEPFVASSSNRVLTTALQKKEMKTKSTFHI